MSTTTTTTAGAVSSSSSSSSSSSTSSTTEALPGKARGGSVVIGDEQLPWTLNPFAPDSSFVTVVIAQLHMAGAYDIDGNTLELVPELVETLPTVENGGVVVEDDGSMTVRYQIRDEAVWSDGTPVTGSDFAYTLDLLQNPPCPGHDVDLLWSAETVDAGPKTYVLRFDSPTLLYETVFTWVVPRHALEGSDVCSDWTTTAWPAAGPFVLDEFDRQGHLRFVRNPHYWKLDAETGEQLPYLDAVEFRYVPDLDEMIGDFVRGEVDVVQVPAFPDAVARLESADGADVQIRTGPVWEHISFSFGPANRNDISLNGRREYRLAVAYALDRDALVRDIPFTFADQAIDRFVALGAATAGSEPWSRYEPDPARVAALLAEACGRSPGSCPGGRPRLTFSTTSNGDVRIRIAEALQAQFEPLGFDVELDLEDSQLFFGETLDKGNWDVGLWAWVITPTAAGVASMFEVFDPDAPPPDGANYYRWGTPGSVTENDPAVAAFRERLGDLRTTLDRDRALTLASELERILADEVVILPIYARARIGAVRADRIGGFVMNPTEASFTWNVEHWWRRDL